MTISHRKYPPAVGLLLMSALFLSARCDDAADERSPLAEAEPEGDSAAAANTDDSEDCVENDGKYLSVAQISAILRTDCPNLLLLNVVDAEFYSLGHIAESVEIPWNELPGRLAEVKSDKDIIIYCRRGVRSESAFTTLQNADYPHLWILDGGLEAWIAAGYPVEAIVPSESER